MIEQRSQFDLLTTEINQFNEEIDQLEKNLINTRKRASQCDTEVNNLAKSLDNKKKSQNILHGVINNTIEKLKVHKNTRDIKKSILSSLFQTQTIPPIQLPLLPLNQQNSIKNKLDLNATLPTTTIEPTSSDKQLQSQIQNSKLALNTQPITKSNTEPSTSIDSNLTNQSQPIMDINNNSTAKNNNFVATHFKHSNGTTVYYYSSKHKKPTPQEPYIRDDSLLLYDLEKDE